MPSVASPQEDPDTSLEIGLIVNESSHPFPHPSVFTFLPEIHSIISRLSLLKAAQNQSDPSHNELLQGRSTTLTSAPSHTLPAPTSFPSQNQLTTTISHESRESNSSKNGDPIAAANATLEIKDIPAQVYAVRQAVLRAKDVVRGLPDIERSIEQQEFEIKTLQRRITGLKGRLDLLGKIAGRPDQMEEDVVMQGTEA